MAPAGSRLPWEDGIWYGQYKQDFPLSVDTGGGDEEWSSMWHILMQGKFLIKGLITVASHIWLRC